CTPNGAYFAGMYPEVGIEPEFRATKPGSTSAVVRLTCCSSATTAPMCGEIAPVAPPGLREIWIHVCPSWCTAAHASPQRPIEILFRCWAVFGIRPCGQRTLP